jgi:hypothetical protein
MMLRMTSLLTLFVVVLGMAACGEEPMPTPVPVPTATQADVTPEPTPTTATGAARSGAFSRVQLVEDVRQLAHLLETAHVDPYIRGGGKIAFHRRFQRLLEAIPAKGLTRDEFVYLLRPCLAADLATVAKPCYARACA